MPDEPFTPDDSNEVAVSLDVEAILEEDLERTGAIQYYRDQAT